MTDQADGQGAAFERSDLEVLHEMTDLEVLMLGVALALRGPAPKGLAPDYVHPAATVIDEGAVWARVADELHARAMRRF